jgi:penicillin-binding protein 1B
VSSRPEGEPGQSSGLRRLLHRIRRSRIVLAFLVIFCLLLAAVLIAGGLVFARFNRLIDERLAGNIFQTTSRLFAAPKRISVGETVAPAELAHYLQATGYSEGNSGGTLGHYTVAGSTVEIVPGSESWFGGKNALRIDFSGRRISRIRSLPTGSRVSSAEIEPEMITSLFDVAREKRRPARFSDLPPHLVDAVLSTEDKRFFDHPGFDYVRVFGAAWVDVQRGEKAQGASTITMQVARSFFFSSRREWGRKVRETLMALLLEHRFSKRQIFELYANQVYLGNRASFAIRGFGEAATAYFGKDVRQLGVAECAFLAGIIRAPNRYSSAERRPDRAVEARDRVLAQMVENGKLKAAEAEAARSAPLRIITSATVSNSAGYFVDMVKDELLDRYSENQLISESYRIYTTLDFDLQRIAAQSIDWGMRTVDQQLSRKFEQWRKKGQEAPLPQAAMVVIDPATGEIRALVGGRDYASSQLNRVLAKRQPGSVFKPFVYAAAFENALEGLDPVLTPASTVVDEPTTFSFNGTAYTPDNFGQDFRGTVSLREALTHSLNVATVKVAEAVGYKRVVAVAKRLGVNSDLQPTPALALGAYDMTPLDVGAGYTVFANQGTRCEPVFVRSVMGPDSEALESEQVRRTAVLDPRVVYLVTSILEDVVNRGTGATVRSRGFRAPAAGKTGTSRDGWFAGYTSNLLCVVWVGFDDNRELGLQGSASAAPIWAEFMRRATALPRYRNTQAFERPDGVVVETIDPETGQLANDTCPNQRQENFIAGTEPTEACSLHQVNPLENIPPVSWLSRIFGGGHDKHTPETPEVALPPDEHQVEKPAGTQAEKKKKPGFFRRIFGGGGDKEKRP